VVGMRVRGEKERKFVKFKLEVWAVGHENKERINLLMGKYSKLSPSSLYNLTKCSITKMKKRKVKDK
jgi:hypothetical protein